MKQTIYAMSVVVALALSGCGSNSSIDPVKNVTSNSETNSSVEDDNITNIEINTSKPIVVVPNINKEVNLTDNSQSTIINVRALNETTNAPYTGGAVYVILPSKVREGVDIGYFKSYQVDVDSNGIAKFEYTGPQDLQSLIDNDDNGSIFEFYHEDNPLNRAMVEVNYTPQSDYQSVNYTLINGSADGKYTMGLGEKKSFTISLKDDNDNLVEDSKVKSILIVSENTVIGKFQPDNKSELSLDGDKATSKTTFNVETSHISGLLPIDIKVTFEDANGEEQTIETKMNITVFSGPATALSISYAGVEADTAHAKFIEKFVVTATDAYNNPVNSKPFIATGAMVEYAVDGSSDDGERDTTSPRLWHGRGSGLEGNITKVDDTSAQFEVDEDVFKYVDFSNDKMVIFGSGYVYEALGKWDIEDLSDSAVSLKDDYLGQKRTGLYYAVGHNNRQDLCSDDGREYVGNMKSPTYRLDDTGSVIIEFSYDYHLTGKDIMVWVNMTGYQADNSDGNKSTRIGEAQKHTLRGMGFTTPNSYTIPKETNEESTYRFNIHHQDVEEWYKNGHFGFVVTGKCTVGEIIDGSNYHDARSCSNEGVAYVDINVSNPSDSECVVSLDNIMVSPEF